MSQEEFNARYPKGTPDAERFFAGAAAILRILDVTGAPVGCKDIYQVTRPRLAGKREALILQDMLLTWEWVEVDRSDTAYSISLTPRGRQMARLVGDKLWRENLN